MGGAASASRCLHAQLLTAASDVLHVGLELLPAPRLRAHEPARHLLQEQRSAAAAVTRPSCRPALAFILRAMRPMNSWKSMVPLPSWSTCGMREHHARRIN